MVPLSWQLNLCSQAGCRAGIYSKRDAYIKRTWKSSQYTWQMIAHQRKSSCSSLSWEDRTHTCHSQQPRLQVCPFPVSPLFFSFWCPKHQRKKSSVHLHFQSSTQTGSKSLLSWTLPLQTDWSTKSQPWLFCQSEQNQQPIHICHQQPMSSTPTQHSPQNSFHWTSYHTCISIKMRTSGIMVSGLGWRDSWTSSSCCHSLASHRSFIFWKISAIPF